MRAVAGVILQILLWGWVVLGLWALAAEASLSRPGAPKSSAAGLVRVLFTPFGHAGIPRRR